MALDQFLLCYNYAINQSPPNYQYFKHSSKLHQGASIGGGDAITTSGSSTTVTAANNNNPFAGVQVGGLIVTYKGDPALNPTPDIVHVASIVSPNQITVDQAVNWSNGGLGYASWFYRDFWSGGGANDVTSGWVMLSKWSAAEVQVVAGSVTSTGGLDMVVETRGLWQRPSADNISLLNVQNFPAGFPVAANFVITEVCPFIRVGFRAHTTANAGESLTVKLVGRFNTMND